MDYFCELKDEPTMIHAPFPKISPHLCAILGQCRDCRRYQQGITSNPNAKLPAISVEVDLLPTMICIWKTNGPALKIWVRRDA